MTTKDYYSLMKQELNEIQWRHFLGQEALRIGSGGINPVMQKTGAAWRTIKKGMEEIEAGKVYQPGGRIRKVGGGRKKLNQHRAGIEEAVEKIADPKGDPESVLRWTSLSMEHIAEASKKEGMVVSAMSVYRILKEKGFALRANKKEIEGHGKDHPDRDAQFHYLNEMCRRQKRRGGLTLSLDAKKSELIGNFKNQGREWQPQGSEVRVKVHDFGEKDEKGKRIKGIPYGVDNLLQKQGFIHLGMDHDTAEFAVEIGPALLPGIWPKIIHPKRSPPSRGCGRFPWSQEPTMESIFATTRQSDRTDDPCLSLPSGNFQVEC